MSEKQSNYSRRRFLKTAIQASTLLAIPQVIPGSALGLSSTVAPSERIALGGIGIGGRGTYDLGCFLGESDVQFIAVCDVKEARRKAIKNMVDLKYDNQDCGTHRDFRELLARDDIDAVLIATGPNWHCTAATYAARAGKDMYCEKPCTKNISQSLKLAETMRRTARVFQAGTQRRNLPHFAFACELARTGKLGKLRRVYAHPAGMTTISSGWLPPEPEPPKEEVDWDMYLGPAAWRPFNRALLDGFNFEKGGGFVGAFGGGGVLEWGSHCVDLCQWAANADSTAPVEYNPPVNGEQICLSGSKGMRAGLKRGTAAYMSSVHPPCWQVEKWLKSVAIPPRSTCVTSWTTSRHVARRNVTRMSPVMHISPAMRRISASS